MKLLSIELRNIGPYENVNISFDVDEQKNIVMICGNNGAGKTTLLKSIKLGLFGSYLYGLKTNTKSSHYMEEVLSIIRNGQKKARIKILFQIVDDYIEKKYEIIRKWTLNNNFKEEISLFINNKEVFNDEKLNELEYINNYFSPKLVDIMLFDGEKINQLIDDKALSTYIKDATLNLFNLRYYLDLITDLDKYINNDLSDDSLSLSQIKLRESEKELKSLTSQLKILQENNKNIEELLKQQSYNLNVMLDEFAQLGGISKKELMNIKNELQNLENFEAKQRLKIKAFLENDILFLLNENLIHASVEQINIEKPGRYIEYINELLESDLCNEEELGCLKKIRARINIDDICNKFLNVNMLEENRFLDNVKKIDDYKNTYNEIIINKRQNKKLIHRLKSFIKINENKDLSNYINKIDEINDDILNTKNELLINFEKQDQLNIKIKVSNEKINHLREEVFANVKENNSYVLAKKYINVCQKFYDDSVRQITERIGDYCTQLLHNTYRKKDYITNVKVDSNFNITAYSGKKIKLLNQLSSGEKQLFIGAMIVSIFKLSNRNLPMIFDTPTARLDKIHMKSFYENIIMHLNHQIIVMPTSTEMNDDVITKIKDRIKTCYTLNYQNNSTIIDENMIFEKRWDYID